MKHAKMFRVRSYEDFISNVRDFIESVADECYENNGTITITDISKKLTSGDEQYFLCGITE